MRRLLLPAALLVALLSIYALRPAWFARAERRGAGFTEERAPADASRTDPPGAVADASADEAAEDARARVHGVVTGPSGAVWCARVVAYRSDTDDVLAEAFTNPEGRYTLPVGVSDFQLAAEPASGVWLAPSGRRGIVLNAGDDLEQNFALAAAARLTGRVVDADGKGFPEILVLAVPAEHAGPFDAHPNAVAGRQTAKCRTGGDGGFRMGGIARGTYSLVIGDAFLTLTSPVMAATDGPDQVLTVAPAIAVHLVVEDIETGDPVDAFSVKVKSEGRVVLEERGSRGVLSRRVPVEAPLDPRAAFVTEVEVAAHGYTTWGPHPVQYRAAQTVRLVPRRDPNTVIRVWFDDGRPYRGGVFLLFGRSPAAGSPQDRHLIDRTGSVLALERVEDGVYRGAMPHGRWSLRVVPEHVFGAPRLVGEVEVGPGRDGEARFVLPAGGELVLMPPRGAPGCSVCIEAEGETAGRRRAVFEVPAEGRRIEGIPPGLCRLGYPRTVFDMASAKGGREPVGTHTVVWFRDVRVVAGGSEQIALPPP